jgi:hypothetical protein
VIDRKLKQKLPDGVLLFVLYNNPELNPEMRVQVIEVVQLREKRKEEA